MDSRNELPDGLRRRLERYEESCTRGLYALIELRKSVGLPVARMEQLVNAHRAFEAIGQLNKSKRESGVFRLLCKLGRPEYTIEYLMLQHPKLFEPFHQWKALMRLRRAGCPMDTYPQNAMEFIKLTKETP